MTVCSTGVMRLQSSLAAELPDWNGYAQSQNSDLSGQGGKLVEVANLS